MLSAIIAIQVLISMLHIRYLNVIPLCSPQSSTGTFSWAHSPGTRSGVQAPWFWHVPQMQVACWHEYPPAVWNSQICHGALFFLFALTCCVIIKTLLLFIISVIIVLWTYEWNIYWQRRRFNIPRFLICQKRLGFSKKICLFMCLEHKKDIWNISLDIFANC